MTCRTHSSSWARTWWNILHVSLFHLIYRKYSSFVAVCGLYFVRSLKCFLLLTGWLVIMMKDHVFVHTFFVYFCSRAAVSFITVVCDTDFGIIYMFIVVTYVYRRTTEDWCSAQKYLWLTSSTNVWNWSPVKSYFLFSKYIWGYMILECLSLYIIIKIIQTSVGILGEHVVCVCVCVSEGHILADIMIGSLYPGFFCVSIQIV
jgi:hypothetical protein